MTRQQLEQADENTAICNKRTCMTMTPETGFVDGVDFPAKRANYHHWMIGGECMVFSYIIPLNEAEQWEFDE